MHQSQLIKTIFMLSWVWVWLFTPAEILASTFSFEDELKSSFPKNKAVKKTVRLHLKDQEEERQRAFLNALNAFRGGLESDKDLTVLFTILTSLEELTSLKNFTDMGAAIQAIVYIEGSSPNAKEKMAFLKTLEKLSQKDLLNPALHTLQALAGYDFSSPSDSNILQKNYRYCLREYFLDPLTELNHWDDDQTPALVNYLLPTLKDVSIANIHGVTSRIKQYIKTLQAAQPQVPHICVTPPDSGESEAGSS